MSLSPARPISPARPPDPIQTEDRTDPDVPLPEGVAGVLALFEGELGALEFPDVSAQLLRHAAARIGDHQRAVAAAKAALLTAESARADAERALLQLAGKGLAYATIYAADHPELRARVAALRLSGTRDATARGGAPRKPRRNRRTEVAVEESSA